MSTPTENSTHLPLRPALRLDDDTPMSPRSGPVKVVSIAEPEDTPLSPEDVPRAKQFPASLSLKRMIGRPIMPSNSSSRLSIISNNSVEDSGASATSKEHSSPEHHHKNREHHVRQHDKLHLQVSEWLQREKAKRAAKKPHKHGSKHHEAKLQDEGETSASSHTRSASGSSDSSGISLEQLQRILEDNVTGIGHDASPSAPPRRPSHISGRRRLSMKRTVSSDTEYQDGDVVVPSCDVVLDNSKTMSYSGGAAESSNETFTLSTSKRAERERKAWLVFKAEIVKLAHTLRLKGWRRVPLENGGDIEVERLSGALTNAVYVVSPPKELPATSGTDFATSHKYNPPPKLLLRIYGPQVEHLIDRENELGILRRLARKKIGPRLLGTFTNGRFEEFFNAQTLTAEDLRIEGTSKQIAKRMRELHDGIELLERERDEGPFVFQNWDKWVGRCSEVIEYLDGEILSGTKGGEPWRTRGLVCGVEWKVFKAVVDKYRKWLEEYYRAKGGVKRNLVFAHNDTQYGNILRLIPEAPSSGSAPSPLLLPQNTHKQLVVIDFEYASANTPGLEFANHFTEWCYNYHDASYPWKCSTNRYPTLEEQRRFIRSYVNHRPQFNPRASATPKMAAMDGLAKGSISEFLLDSRTPGGSASNLDLAHSNYAEDEKRREAETERQVEELVKETRIWRIANSAQWVAWGIVQAKVPELDEPQVLEDVEKTEEPEQIYANGEAKHDCRSDERPEGLKAEALLNGANLSGKEAEQLDEEEEDFDYLGYAQERAMFFWGDVVGLGLVKREELRENLVSGLKIVEY